MTLLQPNLQLRKLRVLDGVRCAYAADFHSGVNIISGQNASGKSTVVDFIFYVLMLWLSCQLTGRPLLSVAW
jgi:AAA15 family ATPase/GTPase